MFDKTKITVDLETGEKTEDFESKDKIRSDFICKKQIVMVKHIKALFNTSNYNEGSLTNIVHIANNSNDVVKVIKHKKMISQAQFVDAEYVFTESLHP